jgi:predicted dienelactone hydrolase
MKKATLLAVIAFLLILNSDVCFSQEKQKLYSSNEHPDMLPEMSKKGELLVGVKTMTITNEDYIDPFDGQLKPRSLKVEVWYPTDDNGELDAEYINQTRNGTTFSISGDARRDAVPSLLKEGSLVVLSHGYTGYRTIMYYLGEHLASHGYLVVSIDHTDSTNEDVDPKKNAFSGFKSTLINRSRDQQFALDYFSNKENTSQLLGGGLTIKNAGVVGYSMGGYGAISTIGGCYNFSDQFTSRMIFTQDEEKVKAAQVVLNTCAGGQPASKYTVDPRWQAMVAFAPWGGQQGVFSEESIRNITVPSLYISGNLDDVSGYNGIKNQFEQTVSADSYLLTYINARHNIAPHPAPREAWTSEYDFGHYYESAWSTQQLNRINQHFALAMMNCYLQEDEKACEYLDLSPSSDQPMEEGKLSESWKGFDHRYGTGMKWGMSKVD